MENYKIKIFEKINHQFQSCDCDYISIQANEFGKCEQ